MTDLEPDGNAAAEEDSESDEPLTPSQRASLMARAAVAAETAEWEASARLLAESESRGRRNRSRSSVVLSVRLDPRELEALERRAFAVGNRPSVVARNFIRTGLSRPAGIPLAELADEADLLAARIREAAGAPPCAS